MKKVVSILLTAALLLGLLAMSATAFAAEDTVITRIEATISGMEVGKPLSGVTVTAPEGANYDVSIYYFADSSAVISDLSHMIGKQYYEVNIQVTPKAGYTLLGDDAEFAISGTGLLNSHAYLRDPDLYYISNEFNFSTPIDKVEVTVTGIEEGKLTSDVKVTVPEGANYQVDGFQIRDSKWDTYEGTFQKGLFTAGIYLVPAAGYRFTEDTVVTLNGGDPDYLDIYPSGETLYLEYEWDLRGLIEKVEITVTGMEEGKTASDVKVTVPEGANYGLDEIRIVDSNWDDFTGTFGKAHYTADIYLEPADGYYFDEDATVTVNGSEPDYLYIEADFLCTEYNAEFRSFIDKVEITATELTQGIDTADLKVTVPENANYTLSEVLLRDSDHNIVTGKLDSYEYYYEIRVEAKEGYFLDENKVTVVFNGGAADYFDDEDGMSVLAVEKEYFLGKYIDKVELPAWPTIQVGDEAPAPQLANGENYMYMGEWFGDDAAVSPGTKFENDRLYRYQYLLQPAEGYAFAEDVKVTVGGKTVTDGLLNSGDLLGVFKSYRLGNPKVVDTLKLSGAVPTAGNAPGTITSTGTGYTLNDAYWGVASDAKGTDVHNAGETFKVGDYVFMAVEFQLEKDYVLDLSFKVLYNGKSYSPILERTGIYNDGTAFTVICLGQLKAASNPDTGDATPVVALTVLTVASILGLGIMASRRKAF